MIILDTTSIFEIYSDQQVALQAFRKYS